MSDLRVEHAIREQRKLNAPKGYWRKRARAVIADVLHASSAAGDTPEQALLRIDAAYPFGARDNHPYKQWLLERVLVRQSLGLVPTRASAAGLLPLFDRTVDE